MLVLLSRFSIQSSTRASMLRSSSNPARRDARGRPARTASKRLILFETASKSCFASRSRTKMSNAPRAPRLRFAQAESRLQLRNDASPRVGRDGVLVQAEAGKDRQQQMSGSAHQTPLRSTYFAPGQVPCLRRHERGTQWVRCKVGCTICGVSLRAEDRQVVREGSVFGHRSVRADRPGGIG